MVVYLSNVVFLSVSVSFVPASSTACLTLNTYVSNWFLDVTRSFSFSSSCRYISASLSILSMSSLDRRPLSFFMVILSDFPVLISLADTFRMPLASRSNVTSIFGTPRGAGGMPVKLNVPNWLLSLLIARSPSNT